MAWAYRTRRHLSLSFSSCFYNGIYRPIARIKTHMGDNLLSFLFFSFFLLLLEGFDTAATINKATTHLSAAAEHKTPATTTTATDTHIHVLRCLSYRVAYKSLFTFYVIRLAGLPVESIASVCLFYTWVCVRDNLPVGSISRGGQQHGNVYINRPVFLCQHVITMA